MSETNVVQRFPFSKLCIEANELGPTPDKKKIFALIEKKWDHWVVNRPADRKPNVPLTPEFKKNAPSVLHAILKTTGNAFKLDSLITAYAMKTDQALDSATMTNLKGQVAALCAESESFELVNGVVYRMIDSKGTKLDTKLPERKGPKAGGKAFDKVVQRFSKQVKAETGLTKDDFVKAVAAGHNTINKLKALKNGSVAASPVAATPAS